MIAVLIFCGVMFGAAELPERCTKWATSYVKYAASAYLSAIQKQARDPQKLGEEIARKTVRKLYNILKVLVVSVVAYLMGNLDPPGRADICLLRAPHCQRNC